MQWDFLPEVGLEQTATRQVNAIKKLSYRMEYRLNGLEKKEQELVKIVQSPSAGNVRTLGMQIASIRRQKAVLGAYVVKLNETISSFSVIQSMEAIKNSIAILNANIQVINASFQTSFTGANAVGNAEELNENNKKVDEFTDKVFNQPLEDVDDILKELSVEKTAQTEDAYLAKYSLK